MRTSGRQRTILEYLIKVFVIFYAEKQRGRKLDIGFGIINCYHIASSLFHIEK